MAGTVVALIEDLMFSSKVREAATALGVEARSVRSLEALVEGCRGGAGLVVVDLDARRLSPIAAIEALRADPSLAGLSVVGFFSHVHEERAEQARAAGCSQVLTRGAFVRELPALLSGLA